MMKNIFAFSGNQGPWGQRGGNGGNGGGGRSGGPRKPQPDIDDVIRDAQERMSRMMGGGGPNGGLSGGLVVVALIVLAIVWLASGIYIVAPEEKGVVLRFGKYVQTTEPGPNYHLPWPIETVIKPKVQRENILEVGFRSSVSVNQGFGSVRQARLNNNQVRDIAQESLMLTGDENIVDLDFTVRWRISDPRDYLFKVQNPDDAIKNVAESAMREVIGRHPIDDALTANKAMIELEVRELSQSLLDEYGAGVIITGVELQQVNPPAAVIGAFRDVQAARADSEKMQNEARGYANDIIPRARGNAAKVMQNAEAYKATKVAEAQGAAKRFEAQLTEYRKAKDVTRERLYLETMERVLKNSNKVIVSGDSGGVLPYLPLNNKGGVK